MTKFLKLSIKKDNKKTIFKKYIDTKFEVQNVVMYGPNDYLNVMFLGHDIIYGDVFKVWNKNENKFTLYFGEKGDEFDD